MSKQFPILCNEPDADGDNLFLVEDESAFKYFQRVSDVIKGSPEEVEHYGGWKYDYTPEEDYAEYLFDGRAKEEFIKQTIAAGTEVVTVAAMKAELIKDDPDCSGYYCGEGS